MRWKWAEGVTRTVGVDKVSLNYLQAYFLGNRILQCLWAAQLKECLRISRNLSDSTATCAYVVLSHHGTYIYDASSPSNLRG